MLVSREAAMKGIRFLAVLLIALSVMLVSACEGLGEKTPQVSARLIKIDYPDGRRAINGETIEFILVNKNNECVSFPVPEGIPIFVYIGNGSVRVRNTLDYSWTAIKMNMIATSSARRRIGVTPYLDPRDVTFTLPMYSAYIPLDGYICEHPEITISLKIPFFIQFFTDY